MKDLKLSRSLLSSYYVSAIFSFFLFQLIHDQVIAWTSWVLITLNTAFGWVVSGDGPIWFALFLMCFGITTLIRQLIVMPLGFYNDNESARNWELWVLLLLILGFYIYLLNNVFQSQNMPPELPAWFVRLVGGTRGSTLLSAQAFQESNTWTIIPWLWNIGPIAFMYYIHLKNKGD